MKPIIVLLLTFTVSCSFGQVIKLEQTKSAEDMALKNGEFTMYFKKGDLIDAMKKINEIQKMDLDLYNDISSVKYPSIDIKSNNDSHKDIINYFEANLAVFLMMQRKVSVYKNNRALKAIVADPSPPMVELDGRTWSRIVFTPENSEDVIYVGNIDKRLSKDSF